MSNTPRSLTRNQLAEFLPNQRAVRAFEQLLTQVGDLLPSDIATINRLIKEVTIDASTAGAKAQLCLDTMGEQFQAALLGSGTTGAKVAQLEFTLTRIADALDLLSLAPRRELLLSDLSDVTSQTPVAGNVQIFNATLQVWKNALLTPGSNVTITNADGSITIAVSGAPPTGTAGGVLSGSYPNPGFAVDMATQSELDTAIATRELTITAGTTAQFWRGDKSWQDLFTQVRAATLTGLSTATNAVITATDTVLSAFGKLQKQISDHFAATAAHGVTGAVVGTTDAQTLTNKALNGSLGATTPSTVSATTVTASGKINSGRVLFYDIAVSSAAPLTITLPESMDSVGAMVVCTGILQNVGARVGSYLIAGYGNAVTTIVAIDVLTVTCNTTAGTITLTSSNANILNGRVKILE